jgi:hypothetical protein
LLNPTARVLFAVDFIYAAFVADVHPRTCARRGETLTALTDGLGGAFSAAGLEKNRRVIPEICDSYAVERRFLLPGRSAKQTVRKRISIIERRWMATLAG